VEVGRGVVRVFKKSGLKVQGLGGTDGRQNVSFIFLVVQVL
jgi:hypothetical protein